MIVDEMEDVSFVYAVRLYTHPDAIPDTIQDK